MENMNNNNKENKQVQATKDIRRVSAKKVLLRAAVLTVVSGLILFITMIGVFYMKLSSGMIRQLDILNEAIDSAVDAPEDVWNSSAEYYSDVILFLAHYQKNTACDDKALLEFGKSHYPEMDFLILSSDEKETDSADFYQTNNIGWKQIQDLLKDRDDSRPALMSVSDGYAGLLSLNDEKVLCALVTSSLEDLLNEIISVSQAIGLRNRDSESIEADSSIGFIRLRESGDIITDDAYYVHAKGEDAAFTTLPNIFSVINFRHNATDYTFDIGEVSGETFFAISRYNEKINGDVYYCLLPIVEMSTDLQMTLFVQLIFFALLSVLGLFALYLRQYTILYTDNSTHSILGLRKRMLVSLLVIVLMIGGVSFFAQTLFSLSINALDDADVLSDIALNYKDSRRRTEDVNKTLKGFYESGLETVADYFGEYPAAMNAAELEKVREIYDLQYIMIYDLNGHEKLSSNDIRNYDFPSNKEDAAYVLNELKYGVKNVCFLDENNLIANNAASVRFAANVYDSKHQPLAYLEFGIRPDELYALAEDEVLSSVLRNISLTEGHLCMAIDPDTHKIVASSQADYLGRNAEDVGFTEESLKAAYFGKLSVNSETCYVSSDMISGLLVYVIHPQSQVYYSRLPYTFAVIVLFLLSFCFLIKDFWNDPKADQQTVYFSKKEEDIISRHQANEIEESSQADQQAVKWLYMAPEYKISRLFEALVELAAAALFIIFLFQELLYTENSLLAHIFSGRWAKGVNVFSFTANAVVLIIAIVIVSTIKLILKLIGQICDPRGETITRLLRSMINYAAVIVVACIWLANIGVDAKILAASAGVIGVAIGIGQKDLLTDIVAGLFILFESTFQVGDIIEVSGYQGIVREIGLRTTIVDGWDFNQKYIYNRNMSNVLNLSAKKNFSNFGFSVAHSISTEKLSAAFEEKFRDYEKTYPEIISAPYFTCTQHKVSGTSECHIVAEISDTARPVLEKVIYQDIQAVLDEQKAKAVWKLLPASLR